MSTTYGNLPWKSSEALIKQILCLKKNINQEYMTENSCSLVICCNSKRSSIKRYVFPSKSFRAVREFLIYYKILLIVLGLLQEEKYATTRDIFYRDVPLFVKQSCVEKCLNDWAHTLNVDRRCLRITASAKGLSYGPVSIVLHGQVMSTFLVENGALIPTLFNDEQFILKDLKSVLVFEKDAIFSGFVRNIASFPELKNSLLITGKGYPDLATREFLRKVELQLKRSGMVYAKTTPVYGIFDFDPHGLEIFLLYKYGSTGSNINVISSMNRIELMFSGLNIESTISLSKQDQIKAMAMLKRPQLPQDIRIALQRMLYFNMKTEIEAIPYSALYNRILSLC